MFKKKNVLNISITYLQLHAYTMKKKWKWYY